MDDLDVDDLGEAEQLHDEGRATPAPAPGPPHEDLRVRVGELELHCAAWGRAGDPAVLLVHGYGGHAQWFAPLAAPLAPGRRLVAVDLRGHGQSEWPETLDYRIESLAGDLLGVVDALGLGRVPVVGHSMGGRAVAWLAAHHPDRLRGAAILDSRMRLPKSGNFEQWRDKLAGRRRGRSYPTRERAEAAFRLIPEEPDVPAETLAWLARFAVVEREPGDWTYRFDRGVLLAGGDGGGDLVEVLAAERADERVPLWIGHGEGSQVLTREEAPALRAALPRARVRAFPGSHHFLLSHPEATVAWLQGFLRAAAAS